MTTHTERTSRPAAEFTCENCGRPDAHRYSDRVLCDDCACGAGSCCPEFGADDLW